MIIVSITFVVRDNTVDNPRHIFLNDINRKGGYNNKSGNFHINDLNLMISLKNKFKFYFNNSNKHATASVILIGVEMYKIERRHFTNNSGGNSLINLFIAIVAMWMISKINHPRVKHVKIC